MTNGESQEIDQNLRSWTVVSVTFTQIKIRLDFENPILVSNGESPDVLFVQLLLGSYMDEKGQSLPPSVLKKVYLPR